MSVISVVIPLYNKAPHICRALDSVLAQTVGPEEIIVIDDGSTDGGGEFVKNYTDPRITLIQQRNSGVSLARNRGIDESKGDLIAFLDADDAWKPQFLETILNLKKLFPHAGLFSTAYEIVLPDGSLKQPNFNILPPGCSQGIVENYFKAASSAPVWTSAVVIPKKVLQEIKGFKKTEVQEEDIEAWLRIALQYPIAWDGNYLACYYKDAMNRADAFKRWKDEPVISRTAREAISSGLITLNQIKDLKEYVANFQIGAAMDCLLLRKKEIALELLDYARGTEKLATKWYKYRILAAIPGNPAPFIYKFLAGILPERFPRNL